MGATVQSWVIVVINAAAAVAFVGIGWRWRNRILSGVGVAFVAAAMLVAGVPPFVSDQAGACGTALGFAASVAGLLGLLKVRLDKSQH